MKKIQAGTDARAVVENHRILASKLSTGAVLTTEEVKRLVDKHLVAHLTDADPDPKLKKSVRTLVEFEGVQYTLKWTLGPWTIHSLGSWNEFPEQVAHVYYQYDTIRPIEVLGRVNVYAVVANHNSLVDKMGTGTVLSADEVAYLNDHYTYKPGVVMIAGMYYSLTGGKAQVAQPLRKPN